MEIDHSTTNLPHVLYHVVIAILYVTIFLGSILLIAKISLRGSKRKQDPARQHSDRSAGLRKARMRKGRR